MSVRMKGMRYSALLGWMTHLLSQLPVSGIVDEEESEGAATTLVDKVSVSSTAFKKKNSAGLTFLDSIMCVSIVISKKKGSETYLPRGTLLLSLISNSSGVRGSSTITSNFFVCFTIVSDSTWTTTSPLAYIFNCKFVTTLKVRVSYSV